MIVLLVLVAVCLALALVNSAMVTVSRVTETDRSSRGRWGIVDVDRARTRPLDAHGRRWQTALISARQQPNRWADIVAEIQRVERSAGMPPDPTPPAAFDRRWIEQRLSQLDALDALHEPEGTP